MGEINSNLYRRPDGSYFYLQENGDEVEVNPLLKLGDNESDWSYIDKDNKLYTPRREHNNGYAIQDNRSNGQRFWDRYLGELKYSYKNNIPIKGKYTIPAIGLSALGALGGSSIIGSIATRGLANTAFDAGVSALGGGAVDMSSRLITGNSLGKNIENISQGYVPETVGAFVNPGFALTPHVLGNAATRMIAGTNIGKRAIETAMRTSSNANPLPALYTGIKKSSLDRKKKVLRYIFTGKQQDTPGYNHWGIIQDKPYQGLFGDTFNPQEGYGDVIDAYLWSKELDPRIARRVEGDPLGVHEKYVIDNYPTKKVRVYQTEPQLQEGQQIVTNPEKIEGIYKTIKDDGSFATSTGMHTYDAQGHVLQDFGDETFRRQDIWKFLASDYMKKYGSKKPSLKSRFVKWGLNTVDRAGNPIIVRTPIIKSTQPINLISDSDLDKFSISSMLKKSNISGKNVIQELLKIKGFDTKKFEANLQKSAAFNLKDFKGDDLQKIDFSKIIKNKPDRAQQLTW